MISDFETIEDDAADAENTAAEVRSYHFAVDETRAGGRIDKILSDLHEDLSRARVQALINDGQVLLNGKPCTSSSKKLVSGDEIAVDIPPPAPWYPEAEDIPLDIVYEDKDLIVINKPAGLVVHPGAGNQTGTLVNALLHHCPDDLSGIGGVMRPGIVHRLDKDTTGLMVVAKNDHTHQGLAAQLEDRSLSRHYKALVLGVPMPPRGVVDQPLGRHHVHRQKMAVNRKYGKDARTHYHLLENYRDVFSLVECVLESGRTHQIRVHMGYIKHQLIGDPFYGPQPTGVYAAVKRAGYDEALGDVLRHFPRQALHAYALSFIHPSTDEELSFEVDLPEDMDNLLNLLDS
jgi:23S rRNA pseudouridine1911/1915/1917 synthase